MIKACKKCHYLTERDICPVCGSEELSTRWSGLAIILNPENSEIAKKINAKVKGKYALMVQ